MLSVVLSLRGLTGPLILIHLLASRTREHGVSVCDGESSIGLKARALVRPVLVVQRLTPKYRFDST